MSLCIKMNECIFQPLLCTIEVPSSVNFVRELTLLICMESMQVQIQVVYLHCIKYAAVFQMHA